MTLLGQVDRPYIDTELILRFYRLFWPEFREYEGQIFIVLPDTTEDDFIQTYEIWAGQLEGADLQRMINHTHLIDELPELAELTEPDRNGVEQIAKALEDTWSSKLKRDYPDREFIVTAEVAPEGDVITTFYEE